MSEVDLTKKIEDGLNDGESWKGRQRAFGFIRPGMQRMVKRYPELTHKLRAVKEYSIDHMDDLLEQATKSLEANGVKVYVAQTEEDARDYIAKIVGKNLVVKSKTNAGKEIGITKYLTSQALK